MVRSPRESVEKDVESGLYIDFSLSRRGSFACITQSKIKDVMQKVFVYICFALRYDILVTL